MASRKVIIIKEKILIVLVSLSIVLMILTNINLVKSNNNFDSTIQTVKGQLDMSEKGLITVPQPNYQLTVIISSIFFIVGIGAGWVLFNK